MRLYGVFTSMFRVSSPTHAIAPSWPLGVAASPVSQVGAWVRVLGVILIIIIKLIVPKLGRLWA